MASGAQEGLHLSRSERAPIPIAPHTPKDTSAASPRPPKTAALVGKPPPAGSPVGGSRGGGSSGGGSPEDGSPEGGAPEDGAKWSSATRPFSPLASVISAVTGDDPSRSTLILCFPGFSGMGLSSMAASTWTPSIRAL